VTSRWYVLRCKPHKEHVLWKQLESKGYEIFFPRFFSRSEKTGRLRIKPYFPGYLFLKVDLTETGMSTFLWMPYTEGLVCFGSKPAYVPDALIQAIRRHVDDLNITKEKQYMDHLQTRGGQEQESSAIGGYRAIFNPGLPSDERVKELLHMLQGMCLSPAIGDS
jgi:transcription antitermination factor NusG